jgi:prolyl oligopeptidase
MCRVMSTPFSAVDPVTETIHGVPITDPYRWLEDQDSQRTCAWINDQTSYARDYLDAIPGREEMRVRVRQFLAVETYDSVQKAGNRYFFRKRLAEQQQPCIYMRQGADGEDMMLLDPSARGTGKFTAVKPLRASPDGGLLLYEVKQGGERTGTFEIFDVEHRRTLPDALPHGLLRGFAFACDGNSFYYVHETAKGNKPLHRSAYQHVLGTSLDHDREIFAAGEDLRLRLTILSGRRQLGLLVSRFLDRVYTDFYLWRMEASEPPVPILRNADYGFAPRFLNGRILAVIDRDAPNRRIVELQPRKDQAPLFFDVIPESDVAIRNWVVTGNYIFVAYTRGARTEIHVFDPYGKHLEHIECADGETLRLAGGDFEDDEVFLLRESFLRPIEIDRYSAISGRRSPWSSRSAPLDPADYGQREIDFTSKDGTSIPMALVGRRDVLKGGAHPAIMTSYGGYGVPMTPQFSVFVAFLIERGCLFALPNIRGGSEFGAKWHNAAKRCNRQTAYDDFLAAAEWLIEAGLTTSQQLAIFGGSNSGLLVAAALTQKPELFRAVVCIAPLSDMLRYHLFDKAYIWKEEFGAADDPDDFAALRNYSPYHHVRDATPYPATMIVSGNADQNCNALHARKLTARLQAANSSLNPVILNYSKFRGHSPVLPLDERIEALTDRMAFLCEHLGIEGEKT